MMLVHLLPGNVQSTVTDMSSTEGSGFLTVAPLEAMGLVKERFRELGTVRAAAVRARGLPVDCEVESARVGHDMASGSPVFLKTRRHVSEQDLDK